jgi:hypothetical protein
MPPARPLILIACASVFMTSCATLLNKSTQEIHIATDNKITGLHAYPATRIDSTTFVVTRGRQDLTLHFRIDTTDKTLLLRSRNSFAFWFNVYNYCAGMLVDWKNPKRYGYPAYTYLTAKDTAIQHHRFPPTPKGRLRFNLAWSPVNVFSLVSPQGRFAAFGPLGLHTALDYFYKPDRFVSLSLGGAIGFPDNQHGADHIKTVAALYANLSNNYTVGSFDLGYGVNFSAFNLVPNTQTNTTHNVGFGPSLSAQYRISDNVRMGLSWQASFPHYFNFVNIRLIVAIPHHRR